MIEGQRRVVSALALGATAALLLVSSSTGGSDVELEYKWKGYKPPSNVFDDIDEGYTAPKWREYKAPSNVFDELPELANADHKWAANVLNDENVFNEIPEDRYPFNPTANGHEWKKWDEGDTSSQRIKEMNVFDHGQGLAAINLGEHAITDADGNGMPFKCRDAESEDGASPCPEKNVFDSLVDPELSKFPIDTKEGGHEWGKTVASLSQDENVFDKEKFPDY